MNETAFETEEFNVSHWVTSGISCKSVKTGGLHHETPVDRLLRIDTIGGVEE